MTRNYSEKTINGILDYVGGGKGGPVEVDTLEQFYQVTKEALVEAKNDVSPPSGQVALEILMFVLAAQCQDEPETC